MSVGLYDADFFKYHQTIFNLEIMKMATYFKKKREITLLSPSFSPEKYTHFYYRKDFNDGTFPRELTQFDNIRYGGLAFSNNHYIAMKEELETCAPDVSIYERYKNVFVENGITNKNLFTTLMRGIHFRLSLDEKTVWDKCEKQINSHGQVLILHDYNLNSIAGGAEAVKQLGATYRRTEKEGYSLYLKFPIKCDLYEDFAKWISFTFVNSQVQYNNIFTDEQINEVVNQLGKERCQNIIYNPLPTSYRTDDFLEEDLIKIFTQVLFLYKNQKQFSLICSDDFRTPPEIKKMFALFTAYGRSGVTPRTSMYYFAKELRPYKRYRTEIIDLPEAIEVFKYVHRHYHQLFKLFYENCGATFKGGKLEID